MFCISQNKFALINVFLLMELILIVKALAGIPVMLSPRGCEGSFFPKCFYALYAYLLLTVLIYKITSNILTLSFSRLHEHLVVGSWYTRILN